MIYPDFLQNGSLIGVTAPSGGINEKKLPSYLLSLEQLKKQGWQIRETADVRLPFVPSAPAEQRGSELNALFSDPQIAAVLCATGGDFLCECLPFVDFAALRSRPKWVQGYSDPTGLLFSITTRLDIATIYGPNAGGFSMEILHPALENSLAFLRGETPVQRSFDRYQPFFADDTPDGSYALTAPVRWEAVNGDFEAEGRLLGGCLDVLESVLLGTPFADVCGFVKRYEADGVIWYFDVFAMTPEQIFYALWRMKQAGWFRTARAFLFGRPAIPNTEYSLFDGYPAALRRALGEGAKIVWNADIGHVKPTFTLINGAYGRVTARNGGGALEMKLI